MNTGIVNIRGKEYMTVAYRVNEFRKRHPDWSLLSEIIHRDSECVVVRAEICTPDGNVVATGHAEEYRNASQINSTSALENAESSAWGRALANFGLAGTELASADEVANAIHQQSKPTRKPKSLEEIEKLLRSCKTLAEMKIVWNALLDSEKSAAEAIKNELKETLK